VRQEVKGRLQRSVANLLAPATLVALSFVVYACGGGGGSSNPTPPAVPSFSITILPSSPAVAPGTTALVQVSVTPQNGFHGAVSITLSGLPSGLSADPLSFSVQNSPQTVTLTASNSLASGNYSFMLKGASGTLSESATVSVGVGALPNFALIQPAVLEVVTRIGSSVPVQFQTQGPSNYLLNFSVEGLPSGVTANFSPNPIVPGGSTTLHLMASPYNQWIQNLPINVVATPAASAPSGNVVMALEVAPPPGTLPNNRSDYLRTDDTPQSIVYDAAHQLIFSSDFFLNRVDVVSRSTRQIMKSIPVMSPRGLALTNDGSKLLVGSDAQQITAINPTTLQVVQRWKLPRLSGAGYGSRELYPMSDGTIVIHLIGLNGGQWRLAIWDPGKNTIAAIAPPPGIDPCFAGASANGTKIVIADCGGPAKAAVYDFAKRTFGPAVSFPGFIYGVAANPDGSRFLILDDGLGLAMYNDQLQPLTLVPAAGFISGFIFSPDGTRIYAVGVFGVPIIVVSDGNTGGFINAAPALGTIPPRTQISPSPFVETPFAVDSSGLIFGSADHGIAFDDSTYSIKYLLGFNATPSFDQTVTPDYGRVNASTRVSFPVGQGFGFIPDVWFGAVAWHSSCAE